MHLKFNLKAALSIVEFEMQNKIKTKKETKLKQ